MTSTNLAIGGATHICYSVGRKSGWLETLAVPIAMRFANYRKPFRGTIFCLRYSAYMARV